MRNISLSDLTVARSGQHTVISIDDNLRHIGPVVPHHYETALRLSGQGFSRRQVACIMGLSEQEIAQMATGNRPYPEAFQMQRMPAKNKQPVHVHFAKSRGREKQTHQVQQNNNDLMWMTVAMQDDAPSKSHSRHDDHHHHTPSHNHDSPSSYDSGSSSDGGGGGGSSD